MNSIIVAVSDNNVIGFNGKIPWHLSEDLKHFKETTIHHCVIMGRKTFESIGKPLPNRKNIIVTNNINYQAIDCFIATSIEEAISISNQGEEIFFIGGSTIYSATIPFVDRIYLTKVFGNFNGDTFFPKLNDRDWGIASSRISESGKCEFLVFDRLRK